MATRYLRTLVPNLYAAGSVNSPAHILRSISTFSRRFSVTSSSSERKLYMVHLKLPGYTECPTSEELDRLYHSFISGGKKSGIGSDKDPRIQDAYTMGPGFTALLSRDEALALREYDGFLLAKPVRDMPLSFGIGTGRRLRDRRIVDHEHEFIWKSERKGVRTRRPPNFFIRDN